MGSVGLNPNRMFAYGFVWTGGRYLLMIFPSLTLFRWLTRLLPHRKTDTSERTMLVGLDQLNLVIFIIAHPDALLDEMAIHLYNEGSDHIYRRDTLSKRLRELQITEKKASTEAYQALSPENQLRVSVFWNRGPPLGVYGLPCFKLIDVDEFGLTLEKCNRTNGWALKCTRVRKDGYYKEGNKLTALIAIKPGDPRLQAHVRGSVQNPRRWSRCIQNRGTSNIVFADFCELMCSDIDVNPVVGSDTDDHRIFLWDNLSSHHSAYVNQTVTGRTGQNQFTIVPHPPYQPKFGPIEYIIYNLTHNVHMRKGTHWTAARLEQEVQAVVNRIGPFEDTFRHCGYKWTICTVTGNVIDELA